jgi:hypothetical protein
MMIFYHFTDVNLMARKSLRYQSGNQNPHIEEQTTQWPKDKVQKDKRHTKHTHKTTDRATRTPLKAGGELMCSQLVITVIFSACPIVQCTDDSTRLHTMLSIGKVILIFHCIVCELVIA